MSEKTISVEMQVKDLHLLYEVIDKIHQRIDDEILKEDNKSEAIELQAKKERYERLWKLLHKRARKQWGEDYG